MRDAVSPAEMARNEITKIVEEREGHCLSADLFFLKDVKCTCPAKTGGSLFLFHKTM